VSPARESGIPASLRILGIDPGTAVVGLGCIELPAARSAPASGIQNAVLLRRGPGRLRLVDACALRLGKPGDPIETRLLRLSEVVVEAFRRLQPDWLAVEEAFYGKSVQSALRIGEARGVILLAAASHGVPVAQYAPATVKLKVAGRGGASKDTLARMLEYTLGIPLAGLAGDATDALAVAYCHSSALEARALAGSETSERP